jgi:alpha-tubulin suppressor-like RCC1 family protein
MNLPHGVSHVVDFSAGEEHSAFLSDKGEVYTWGYGNDGQLGHQERTNLTQPKKLIFSSEIAKVICGGGHTGIITKEKTLYLFGRGRDGQLGRGDEVESAAAFRTEPKEVTSF